MELNSKAAQLAEQLELVIFRDNLRPGDPIYSEARISKKYGVSRSTTRRALATLEEHGVIDRRKGKGTFIADNINAIREKADSSATFSRESKDVVIILSSVDNHYHGGIWKACERTLKRNGHRVYIVTAKDRNDYLSHLDEKHVAGVIASVPHLGFERDMPKGFAPKLVMVNQECDGSWDQVINDDVPGAYMATTYLISIGHREITHIAGPENTSMGLARRDGYLKAMNEARLFDAIDIEHTVFAIESAYEKMKKILKRKTPDAVFCGGDHIARGAYQAIQEARLRIPEDISVVGYGNVGLNLFPRLTTVDQAPEIMGQVAARLLLARFDDNDAKPEIVRIPTRLVFGESCRPK